MSFFIFYYPMLSIIVFSILVAFLISTIFFLSLSIKKFFESYLKDVSFMKNFELQNLNKEHVFKSFFVVFLLLISSLYIHKTITVLNKMNGNNEINSLYQISWQAGEIILWKKENIQELKLIENSNMNNSHISRTYVSTIECNGSSYDDCVFKIKKALENKKI